MALKAGSVEKLLDCGIQILCDSVFERYRILFTADLINR